MLNNQFESKFENIKNLSNKSITVPGNEGLLHQVFVNILTNSLQAIDDKGEIIVKTKISEKNIIIEITDNGIGIKEENISKITDPFFTTKDPGEGTGLGLSIAYSIIKKHNGSIVFNSEQNKGTTAIISLLL